MDEAAARAQAQAQSADATETSATGPVAKSTASGGAAAVGFARAQLGLPYVWGGAGPKSYDCSGLTMRAWARGGVALPHFAADQYSRSRRVGYGQLRPGDLVFWSHGGKPQDIYHVAIYIGGDKMIEAPHTGAVVKVADLFIMGTPDFYARP
jgi:cell wall-associated NlpC family hydrolase